MKDSSYCPFKHHNGLLLECNYRDVICKRQWCPYFPTLEQAKAAYKRRWQEVGKVMKPCIEEMRRKLNEANKELQTKED